MAKTTKSEQKNQACEALKIVRAAKNYLQEGWIQGALKETENGHDSFCVMGALGEAYGDSRGGEAGIAARLFTKNDLIFKSFQHAFRKEIRKRKEGVDEFGVEYGDFGATEMSDIIVDFNDDDGTSKRQVLARFNSALRYIEKQMK